jgi:hypothetical protein
MYEIWDKADFMERNMGWTTPYHEERQEVVAFEGPNIEVAVPRRLLGLDPGAEIAVLLREHNGARDTEWSAVRSLILPRAMAGVARQVHGPVCAEPAHAADE